ncbi:MULTISPECIES: NCS1 family nucleobase:cation symporter-1 [Microvirgula]|uniref:Nitrate reductase n=1 Tax=Microvirgula aerodenitrificans TaxID=57480 RepID=A0A2S0PAX2_9NEIS|nr:MULTISPECIES: NCS1 family nucleobase:cation symporter-1 [Microvirgula]AVY94529.1 nitrate reductase [Microvirgula aerodenitrificans]RAS19042.1 NCS1 family nucleobase:cation symporter-1 [Microvirgula sp. AG722]
MNAPDPSTLPPSYSPRLTNDDLLPISRRSWGTYNYFAMWMSDIHSVGGYVFAAGLFFLGLSGWQILLAMMAGILVVNKLLDGVGVMGQQLGVPYPVIARLSFGVFGANLPAILRAIVGIVWYGVQTWLASTALVIMVAALWPAAVGRLDGMWLGLTELGWICLMIMWCLQLALFWRGMEWVRRFIDFCGPAVYLVMFALAAWMLSQAGWGALTLSLSDKTLSPGETLYQMLSVVALVIAYFAALLLNFADFSRFGVSTKAVRRGNFLGLPINFLAFALVTVAVTASTVSVFGEAILDPIHVVQRIDHPTVLVLGCLTFVIATIGINIVANFVSAAYDIANIAPKHISFWRGGVITAVLSILVMPWSLYHNPIVINLFVGCLGACLGPLFGVIITDYYAIARRQVDISALYSESPDGAYWYHRGVNRRAVLAFFVAAIPSCVIALWSPLERLAPFAWIIGTLLASALYWLLMKHRRQPVI